ncbi:ATP-binding cassette domain-containing protein [Sphingobacterium corticis]|uniref:ATP-binding cassette domain-containing protein n=1 Tax=Sphingobacterium corticis TaxID=1812823 RepID=A0ABW5NGU8_9SPHI
MKAITNQKREKEFYVDSVQFAYNSQRNILTGGYLACGVGDVLALVGRNGCGKSTLMKVAFGSLKAHHSYIRLNGERITNAFESKDVCYLPQDRFLLTSMRVRKAIDLMISDDRGKENIMSHPILKPVLDNLVADLSGGECRFLEIMLILHQPATFMLLDEPFSGLSPIMKDEVCAQILHLHDKKGIVISDHDYRYMLDIATKITLLQNGSCRNIRDKKELEMFYVPDGTFSD